MAGQERRWQFRAACPWAEGEYTLTVNGRLEDLAGNTPLRLFDVDLRDPTPKPPRLTLRFRPRR